MVAMTPMFIRTLITSLALTAILFASSETVTVSPIPTSRTTGAVGISNACRSEERRVGKECRSLCDWSSDVCSSDLFIGLDGHLVRKLGDSDGLTDTHFANDRCGRHFERVQIGRASCRERV